MGAAVAFLWHMHQPYYRNPVGGEYRMPWTFLHAAKDYYDMLRLAVDGGARVTFNLVPSLVDQLADYADPAVPDTFLDPLRAHPSELRAEARADLLPRLLFAHPENQIRPLPRYHELQEKIRYHGARAAEALADPDWLDLQTLFLLSWTGEVVRAEEPEVGRLLARGRSFRQADKLALLAVLHRVSGQTVGAYREAQDRGQVELSTTPYYHPILPLLLDVESARQAMPRVTLPVIQRGFGADAAWHVDAAIERYRALFGRNPAGFWPAEGSVSTEALGLLADRGVAWAASDEDVLAGSLGVDLKGSARGELYRPYAVRSPGGREIEVFFRDKELADLIGFSYAAWEPELAARDFVGRLEALARGPARGGTVSVILDGENAWEFYRHNAAPFHRALYRGIAASPELRLAPFSECRGGARPLGRVRAGSWIYASFGTWLGHPEKNRAWELLERTRCRLEDEQAGLAEADRALAWREIRIAEGSDWFWWLGDDHYSPVAGEFDELFRLHLRNVYRILGADPPADLYAPIKGGVRRGLLELPVGPVSPRVDGAASSYFEWLAAGLFDLGYDAGAMHRTARSLRWLRYGTGGGRLHLRVEGDGSLAELRGRGLWLEVDALADTKLRVRFPLDGGAPAIQEGDPGGGFAFAWGRVGEASVPLQALGERPERVYLALRLLADGAVEEQAPLYGMAELALPGDYDLESWSA